MRVKDFPIKGSITFLGACADTAKAWRSGNLLGLSQPANIRRVRAAMERADPQEMAELMAEMAGPVAPGDPRQAFGVQAERQLRMSTLVMRLIIRAAARQWRRRSTPGPRLDMDLVRERCCAWIDAGDWPAIDHLDSPDAADRAQAQKIAELLGEGVAAAEAGRRRLAIMASMAAPLELLHIVANLPQAVVDNLSATRRASSAHGELNQADLDYVDGMVAKVFPDDGQRGAEVGDPVAAANECIDRSRSGNWLSRVMGGLRGRG